MTKDLFPTTTAPSPPSVLTQAHQRLHLLYQVSDLLQPLQVIKVEVCIRPWGAGGPWFPGGPWGPGVPLFLMPFIPLVLSMPSSPPAGIFISSEMSIPSSLKSSWKIAATSSGATPCISSAENPRSSDSILATTSMTISGVDMEAATPRHRHSAATRVGFMVADRWRGYCDWLIETWFS